MEQYNGYNRSQPMGQYTDYNEGQPTGQYPNQKPEGTPAKQMSDADMIVKKLKKEMVINRIISCVNLVMTTAILVLAIVAFMKVSDFIKELEPVVEELSKIDIEALNESLNNFNNLIETFNIDDLMDTINSIDFEAINEVLEAIDVKELTETLENINEGADRLDQISEWFEESPLNIFGIGNS